MYLKSIELYGFKSFAERTVLTFDRQLTAIVGPNGCGKSNIVDAIRWSLGEQSAYSLRTPQMLGVVFNGSQTRPSMNLAQVNLTFDNSSKILPIDYSEVSITRKLFRSGESEYYINKTQCRLKDIRDLVLDTGIGREGYSIFEQGKVEFVTTAKPEERRALFEEAAGVAKYKVRREETLRKLERVHNDMNRVRDIMSIIKEQINSLESAVRKARLYQKYQEELHTLEVADITQKIFKLETELKPLEKAIEEYNQLLIEKNTAIDTVSGEIANLEFEKTSREKALSQLHTELNLSDKQIALSEERSQTAVERIKEFKERQQTLKSNIVNFDERIKGLKETIEKIQVELQQQSTTASSFRTDYDIKKNEFENIKSEILQVQQKINKYNQEVFEIQNKRVNRNNELAKFNSRLGFNLNLISSKKQELKKILTEKAKLQNEIETLKAELAGLEKNISAVTDEYNQTTDKLNQLQEEFQLQEIKYNQTKEKYFVLASRISALKELHKTDPKLRAVYGVISQNFHGIHGTVSSILKFPALYTDLLTNLFGEKLNYIVCENSKVALKAIEYIKENKLGWASFIVLDSIPDIQEKKFIGELKGEKPLSSIVSCKGKYEKLLKFLVANTYFAGQTVFSECIIHGGSTEIVPPSESELKSLEEQIEVLNSELKTQEEKLNNIKSEISTTSTVQREKYSKLQESKLSKEALRKQLQDKLEELKLTNTEYETVESEIETVNKEAEKIKDTLPEIEKEISQLEELLGSIKTEITKLSAKYTELQKVEREKSIELTEVTKNLSSGEERLNSYKREVDSQTKNLQLYKDQTAEAQKEIKALSEKISEQEKILTTESNRIDELHEKKTELEKKLKSLQADYEKLCKNVNEKQNKLQGLRTELNNLQQKIHNVGIEQKGKEVEKRTLEKQLSESGIEYLDAKETYLNIEIDREQMTRLKRRIESLGAVNLAAQEQYTDLEKRYNFLLEQQQDLLKAEEDLREAIRKINTSIRENFRMVFEQVRENFKTVFSELFEGGEADLILTDEENLLESGIEVIAQPPGKKLQSITLLSGGEKALTAIALLFAFFMVKPSPICVLDEVDASLDDANISRFINLIKSFSENSQFIIITHNKRTIESADVIYGVTMEEYGISKIVSLRLQKVLQPGAFSEEKEPALINR
ncbi:MAG: AAA family ATPase [Elusimicrobiota bacterium]|nr:AAA family ATPase [Elusimicrobiota bacterium]